MYDTLLFLHVLAAAALFASVVMFSAWVLGAPTDSRSARIAQAAGGIGLIGTLILGIWLAIDVDGYELWDAWILIAFVLWLVAGGSGDKADRGLRESITAGGAAISNQIAGPHWVRTMAVVLLLADMVYKPWA